MRSYLLATCLVILTSSPLLASDQQEEGANPRPIVTQSQDADHEDRGPAQRVRFNLREQDFNPNIVRPNDVYRYLMTSACWYLASQRLNNPPMAVILFVLGLIQLGKSKLGQYFFFNTLERLGRR